MEKTLEILVVEDKPKHIADAKAEVQRRVGRGDAISADYAGTLNEAMRYLNEKQYDGIVCDIFFPAEEGGAEEQNGTKVCDYALDKEIPIVLCTDTYHHGAKTEPVNQYAKEKKITLVDVLPATDEMKDGEAGQKNWKVAFTVAAVRALAKRGLTPREHLPEDEMADFYEAMGLPVL